MQNWFSRQWRDVSGNVKFWILSLLGAGIVTAAVAITHGLSWQQQATLVALFALLFCWAVVATYHATRKPRQSVDDTTAITLENIETNVRGWLDASEMQVRRLPSDAIIYFGFEVTTVSGTPLAILHARVDDKYLTFMTRIGLSAEHQRVFDAMPEREKLRMLRTFRLEAAKSKIEFISQHGFSPVTIQSRIPITSTLTEADFLRAVNEANFSAIVVKDSLGLALEPEPPSGVVSSP